MNWLIAKQILQKAWFYIKNYWWVGALIALGFVLHKFFLFDKDVLGGLYEEKAKQNEKELKVIAEYDDQLEMLNKYFVKKDPFKT